MKKKMNYSYIIKKKKKTRYTELNESLKTCKIN